MDRIREDYIAEKASAPPASRPGVIERASFYLARGAGRVIDGGAKALARVSRVLNGSARRKRPPLAPDGIRAIILEELRRSRSDGGEGELAELQKRLATMAQTIEALQERIAELSRPGVANRAAFSAAIASMEGASSLSDEEKAILARIFRQNIAIQKPELIDAAAGEALASAVAVVGSDALTGEDDFKEQKNG